MFEDGCCRTHSLTTHNLRTRREQSGLNRWPLDMQSNDLPLSYIPVEYSWIWFHIKSGRDNNRLENIAVGKCGIFKNCLLLYYDDIFTCASIYVNMEEYTCTVIRKMMEIFRRRGSNCLQSITNKHFFFVNSTKHYMNTFVQSEMLPCVLFFERHIYT